MQASVALHALARWYQRSFDASLDALRADLLAIARAHDAILAGPWDRGFAVPTGAGRWVGEIVRVDGKGGPQTVSSVRSFLS
jgi:hypothetical protein